MDLVLKILYCITSMGIIYYAVRLNYHLKKNFTWIRNYKKSENLKPQIYPEFVILLSVYNERGNIERALQNLSKLNYIGKKEIYIITTEKEIYYHNNIKEGTTIDEVERLLKTKKYNFHHIHYPGKEGNKASQLNFAMDQLKVTYKNNQENIYVAVYDIDSIPPQNILFNVVNMIEFYKKNCGTDPIVLQQPSSFCQKIESQSLYTILEAICQTRWSVGYEITEEKESIVKIKHRVSYAYCVGHGMFIKAEFLWSNGGFTEPSEDVQMGFRLNLLGIPIYPIPYLDTATVPEKFKNIIIQSGRWFVNIFLLQKEYRYIKKVKNIDKLRKNLIFLKSYVDIFSWIVHLSHFIITIALAIFYQCPILIVVSFLLYYLDYGVGVFLTFTEGKDSILELNSLSKFKLICLITISPIRGIIRGIAPFVAIFNFFTGNDYRYRNKGK